MPGRHGSCIYACMLGRIGAQQGCCGGHALTGGSKFASIPQIQAQAMYFCWSIENGLAAVLRMSVQTWQSHAQHCIVLNSDLSIQLHFVRGGFCIWAAYGASSTIMPTARSLL